MLLTFRICKYYSFFLLQLNTLVRQIKLSCKIMPEKIFLLQEKFLQENALDLAGILQDRVRKGPFLLQDLSFVILQDGFFWELIN